MAPRRTPDSEPLLLDNSTQGQCCWFELSRTAVAIVLFAIASLAIALVVSVVALLLKNYNEYGIGVTPTGSDPYATGRFVPCIYGSFPCLWNWNISSSEWGYVCTLGTDCPNDSGARPSLSVVLARLDSRDAALIEAEMRSTSPEVHQVFCDRVVHGTLRGHKVLLVLTSPGRDRAAVCMSDLLRLYGRLILEVIYVGTARFSPRAGGVIDSTNNCSKAAPALEPFPDAGPAVKLTLIGDICVSAVAASWDCQRCADDDDRASFLPDSTPWWSACRKLHCEVRASRVAGAQSPLSRLRWPPAVADVASARSFGSTQRSPRLGEPAPADAGAAPAAPPLAPGAAARALAPAAGADENDDNDGGGAKPGAPTARVDADGDDDEPSPDAGSGAGAVEIGSRDRLPPQVTPPEAFVPPAVTPLILPGTDAANCEYWSQWDSLVELTHASALSDSPPERLGGELKELVGRYWKAMSDGTGQDYLAVLRDTPLILGNDECAEASSETHWRGAPYDETARRAVQDAIGNAYAAKGEARPKAPPVAVSAMEGAGWMSVLAVRERYLDRPIPFVNIRANAGYTHEPVHLVREYNTWRESPDWLREDERGTYEVLAKARASEAAARVLLRLFDARSKPFGARDWAASDRGADLAADRRR
ncbi:hypothetical protein KFE25_005573 [Diacronema lutheri]|uniref:Uncharacterized protein n=1 Tax=Diacronema lutheri TaxID=2081491 RepID=A0A8J5XJT0_DIALT|nr:hypothetical protein KFE25_005573 [Diacronema lutheri]